MSIQRIDFQNSNIRWITHAEKSMGTFQVEAIARLWLDELREPKLFALGAAVLAGNMYVDGKLCKDPPYLFQVASGMGEYGIFRTALSFKLFDTVKRVLGLANAPDSFGLIESKFESFNINLKMEAAETLQSYNEVAQHYVRGDVFTCLITIMDSAKGRLELEFPVKHLNLLQGRQIWQMETGPILFPCASEYIPSESSQLSDFLPYFVHANKHDCADFSPDFPFLKIASQRGLMAYGGVKQCKVQLLVKK
jgi:hypothetical protein